MVSLLLQALILCPDPYISSENTIMDQAHSDKVPVTFQEFVARFSENEMKLLQEWQKELYQNVMKEIEHALISLGPHIARSVFSLRAKDKQELFVMEHEDTETRLNVSQYTNSPSCISVSIPAIEQDDVNLVEVPDIKGESSAVPSTRSVPFNTTKDANTNTMDQQRSEKTDQMISHTGQPLAELGLRQSCINEKGAIFVEEEDAKRRSIAGPVVTAVFSLGSNSEEDMHCKVKEEPDGRISELELVEGPKAADIICSVGFEEPVDGGDAAGSKEVNKHSSSTPLEYVQSQRGSKMLVWKGYLHRKERETSGKILWRCAQYQMLKCCCRVHTIGEAVVHYTPHNHLPKPWEVESKKTKAAMRQKLPVKRKAKTEMS